jgi:hypothetical protein
MNTTTHIVRRKNDGKYFKVVTHPILIIELNSANPNDLKGKTTTMPTDIDTLLFNGYEVVNGDNGVNRTSSNISNRSNRSNRNSRSRSSRSRSSRNRSNSTTKSNSTMTTMSSRKSSKGGKKSRNLKYKNKTKKV